MDDATAPVRARALELVAELGPIFRDRAPEYDREARFPFENYADLRNAGLLAPLHPASGTAAWAPGSATTCTSARRSAGTAR